MLAGGNIPPLFSSAEAIFQNLASSPVRDCSNHKISEQLARPVWGVVAGVPEAISGLDESQSSDICSACGLAGVLYYMMEYLSPAHRLLVQANQISLHMIENNIGTTDTVALHADCEEAIRLFRCSIIAKEIAFIKNTILGGDLLTDWKRLEAPMTENGTIDAEHFRQKTIRSPHAFLIKELLLVLQDYYQVPVLIIPINDKEIGIAMDKTDLSRIRELEQVETKRKPVGKLLG